MALTDRWTNNLPLGLIPLLFLVIPIAEIAVFIAIGQQIGVLPTLLLIVLTAIVGTILLRVQGFSLLAQIRREVDAGNVPGRELVHGVMLLVAGVLLLTPGFVTDTLGFLLFVPAVRDKAWNALKSQVVVVARSDFASRRSGFGPHGPGPNTGPDTGGTAGHGAARRRSDPVQRSADGKATFDLDPDDYEVRRD